MTPPGNAAAERRKKYRRNDDEAQRDQLDVPLLKGPLRVRGAKQRIAELEQVIRDGERQGQELCDAFIRQFPSAPAKIVRYNDRSLTAYRWRQSAEKKWGNDSTTAIGLTGEAGLKLLSRVPESARGHWLNYERRRIYLNLRLSLANYELYRLQDWIDNLDIIKTIEAEGLDASQA